jgi:UDP-2,3-diacylglucosamine pyrophosphatase LpxH
MLVIISDLHLTDGTSGSTINEQAFRVFRERVRDMAYDASWRADNQYKPIESFDIILLGDILDIIRSSKWPVDPNKAGYVSPWGDPKSRVFQTKVGEISDAILQRNKISLDILKSLTDPKQVTLPPAAAGGRPEKVGWEPDAPGRLPVQVRLHYLVGNHDWFYHLSGTPYNAIRKRVVTAMGLANSPSEPFPHDPDESDVITELYRQHALFARHGDIYDAFNFEGQRDASSLGDAIVVNLLNRFPQQVEEEMGRDLAGTCLRGLREIDNVRPLQIIPVWVDGLLQRTCPSRDQRQQVKDIWDRLVDEFLALKFVQERDTLSPADKVDRLELALKFSKGLSLSSASRLMTWATEKFGGRDEPFFKHALRERAFKNRSAKHVVYGHTHFPEVIPLDSSVGPDGLLQQMYFNSGTWRRVYEMTKLDPGEEEFIGYNVMTYLGFFKQDERGGRPFESWQGSLAVDQ